MNNDNEKQTSEKLNIEDSNERSVKGWNQEKLNDIPDESLSFDEEDEQDSNLEIETVEEDASTISNREAIRKQKEEKKKRKRARLRLIPIWARIMLVTLLFIVSLVAGAMFGYGVIGDGNPTDILGKGPWLKIHDIIYKE